jgi:hypothetical protein
MALLCIVIFAFISWRILRWANFQMIIKI